MFHWGPDWKLWINKCESGRAARHLDEEVEFGGQRDNSNGVMDIKYYIFENIDSETIAECMEMISFIFKKVNCELLKKMDMLPLLLGLNFKRLWLSVV